MRAPPRASTQTPSLGRRAAREQVRDRRPARPTRDEVGAGAACDVDYRLVSAALGSERSPVGAVFGDLLVRRASATGLRRSLRLFPDADVLHVANAGHFALLNHPEVDHALAGWLA